MTVSVRLLGGFDVVVDSVAVPSSAWSRRHSAALVKLLSLTDGRRLHREQVAEALWPGLELEAVGPRLHKAAHYARRALGAGAREGEDAVSLRHDMVQLLPGREDVVVDAGELLRRGRRAVAAHDPAEAGKVLDRYHGGLLPEDLYEPWAAEPREAVRAVRLELLRLASRWEELLVEEPANEEAHLALAQAATERGDQRAALRQLERFERAVRRELGTAPGPAAAALRARLAGATPKVPAQRSTAPAERAVLVGRRGLVERLRQRIDDAAAGRGGPLVLSGPAGVGKTALLERAVAHASARGFRVARGAASAVEGPWPYASVLEAFGDLSRSHPALLDGLDDVYREEVDRALRGRVARWRGESSHQRLFVAAAELSRLAATGHGLFMVVDDVHEADEASLRLLHYLARFATHEPFLLVLAHRPLDDGPARSVLGSLLARDAEAEVVVPPLSRPATLRLLEQAGLAPEAREQVADVAAGIPFTALTLARAARSGKPVDIVPALPPPVLRTFRRVALLGTTFTTDELLAVTEHPEEESYRHLEAALIALLVEPTQTGYRFRHLQVRDALVAQLSTTESVSSRVTVADRLAAMGAPPARVAHQLLAAGMPRRAVPFVTRAVETAGALGAYQDALALVDRVLDHAGPEELPRLMARRGDLLAAMGDPEAASAYAKALPRLTGVDERLVRTRLARVAAFAGDIDTATAALAGLELEGDAADGPLLMAQGNLAYFRGDLDAAWDVSMRARSLLDLTNEWCNLVDLVSLQGLVAHQRGEWFDRFRMELRRTQGKERLATAVFDAHLCVAEYMLYGPVPYEEVITEAEELRRRASRTGALRGVAFATALIGEAALLRGDLDRAERELTEAAELHRDMDASAGEAHSLQRLAEVRLATGDRHEAVRLLRRALPSARWSATGMQMHLLQRIYGTLIAAAEEGAAALAVVDEAEAALGEGDRCLFCDVMLEVPAAIASADAHDLDGAVRHLEAARRSASRWEGSAWSAGVAEADAHLARARGRERELRLLGQEAARLYDEAGQPRDAARCRAWLAAVELSPVS